MRRVAPLAERFWARVERTDSCWLWTGAQARGYGMFSVEGKRGKKEGAHRVSYRLARGDIPAGGSVLHRCDNPRCVRPDHLFLGTQSENMADMRAKGRGSKPPRLVGRANPSAKLNENLVRRIRLYALSHKQNETAAKFGISPALCNLVVRRKVWRHVDA